MRVFLCVKFYYLHFDQIPVSIKKIIGIIIGIIIVIGAIWIISLMIMGGALPVYSYNTLEELCTNKDEIFWKGNWREIRDEQIRNHAQARMEGSVTMDLMTFELHLNNELTDLFMQQQDINPQLLSEVFMLVGGSGESQACRRIVLDDDSEYQKSADYYASIGSWKWKNQMYAELEEQKITQDCDYIHNKIQEIKQIESNVLAGSDIQDEINSVKSAWMTAENWICK